MTVPKHIKIVFRGIFNTTEEEWSFSTKWDMVHTGDPDGDIGNIDAGGVHDALTGMLATANFSSVVWCTGWRAYEIGTNGLMEGNPRIEEFDPADYVKGTSSAVAVPQIALCVTTVAENRGPARLGRFYLPGPTPVLGAGCILTETAQGTHLTNVTQFLKDVADSIDVPASPVSTSMINVSAVGGGALQTVQSVRVGAALDTVRRRRNKLDERYVESGTIDW